VRKTPLEPWIASKISANSPEEGFSQARLARYQLEKLRETIEYVRSRSPFYREHLPGNSGEQLRDLEGIGEFPFTTSQHLCERGPEILCVSQSAIERVVTIPMPGARSNLKRLFFTKEDVELTVDFFHIGMSTLVEPGQKVMILMPGDRPASVGDLLVRALDRMNVEGIVHGLVESPAATIREIVRHAADCLVGIPAQVLSLVRHETAASIPHGRLRSVLLSADYVSPAIVREVERVWGCPVLNHYGTTEMGFGAAVECEARQGYHYREADLFVEIVDPSSGKPQPIGTRGEMVITTLTREGMPLIRYRTGDLARFLPEPCQCGTLLSRIETVRGRLNDSVRVGAAHWLSVADLDDVLFPIPGLVDYQAVLTDGETSDRLDITLFPGASDEPAAADSARRAVATCEVVRRAIDDGSLSIGSVRIGVERPQINGTSKRAIHDKRSAEKNP